jgi:hypothetical protein
MKTTNLHKDFGSADDWHITILFENENVAKLLSTKQSDVYETSIDFSKVSVESILAVLAYKLSGSSCENIILSALAHLMTQRLELANFKKLLAKYAITSDGDVAYLHDFYLKQFSSISEFEEYLKICMAV